ncbi:ABC transporter permease [Agrobacterium tumefaciens]|uniref:ABC transporter permease n=1 Tax=Agrobacterium tumefaciens complex TaxID=1183400 RepID=UPI0015724816|nr:ABC transporter permease [Agrobacterium fabrum]NSZ09733.1 ABC transporter permease [Agrobacterium tumefaciens]
MNPAHSEPATRTERLALVLNAPLFIFLILVLVIPIVGIILFSFSSEHRLENYAEVLTSPVFVRVIATTVALGAIVAFTTIISAFIFSLWVLRLGAHAKALAIGLIVLPFFTSYLLRALSWIPMLGYNGLVNRLLLGLGLADTPLQLIYNPFAVVLGTSNVLFPVAVLPLLAAFHRIDQRLLDAAESLGASRWTAFRRVFLPLVAPATLSTAVMVFAVATGFYITPSVLGGGKVLLAPNLIELLIHRRGEWGTGAALTIVLLVVFMSSIALARRLGHPRRRQS